MRRDPRVRRPRISCAPESLEPRIVLSATSQDLLISDSYNNQILEYTPGGQLVRVLDVPAIDGWGPRDLIQDASGKVHVYNGVFDPSLSTFDPGAASWSHRTHPGWNTANNLTYGGIDVFGQYVYATDMSPFGGGDEPGLIRFDTAAGTSQRFAEDTEFWDLDVGQDGLLYGLTYYALKVYDPATMDLLRTVSLPGDYGEPREVAVDAGGDLFVGTWDNRILHYDADAAVLKNSAYLYYGLYDMDLADDGRIATAAWGTITLTDTSLAWQTTFGVASSSPLFVAFGHVPEYTAGGPYYGVEGGSVTFDGSGAILEGQDPSAVTFEWDLDYDGGTFDVDATGLRPTVAFPDNFRTRAIGLRVTEPGAAPRVLTAVLVLDNADPVVTGFTSSSPELGGAVEGAPVTVTAAISDPGILDSFRATIDWGDGSPVETFTYAAGTTSLAERHVYRDGGSYPILLTLYDDSGIAFGQSRAVVSGTRLNGNTLEIYGTNGPDTLTIGLLNDTTARVRASFLAAPKLYDLVWAEQIRVTLGGGDDRATIAAGIPRTTLIEGGAGNDQLTTNGPAAVFLGGDGNDTLTGGSGRDILIGGAGADRLVAGGGEDILVGGSTVHEAEPEAFWYISAEWNGAGDFWSRTARLRSIFFPGSVFDDAAVDNLNGGADLDWFLAGTNDKTDKRRGE